VRTENLFAFSRTTSYTQIQRMFWEKASQKAPHGLPPKSYKFWPFCKFVLKKKIEKRKSLRISQFMKLNFKTVLLIETDPIAAKIYFDLFTKTSAILVQCINTWSVAVLGYWLY
jgi:hypothetical protein